MKNVLFRLVFIIFMLIGTTSAFTEMQVGLTLINNLAVTHSLSNNFLGSSNSWLSGGDVAAHLTVNPGMNFEDNFQCDAFLDLYFLKNYDTDPLAINIKQAFVDLLFFDLVGFKIGFIQTDYGFNNNYFHPLDVNEFIPDFRSKYPDIIVGANNLGSPGVPSIRLHFTIPEFIEDLKIGLEQALVWFDFSHFDKNYFLSSLSVTYNNFQNGIVVGYTNGRAPVLGMNMSIGLPFKTFLLWEGVYHWESYRSLVQDDTIITNRQEPFFNQSVRLQTSQEEPLFHNTLAIYAEYFFYGEGLSPEQYDAIDSYFTTTNFSLILYKSLLIRERNFKNYLTMGFDYLTNDKWSFSYRAIAELDSSSWQHWIMLGKAFNSVTVGGTFIFTQTDPKYQLIYSARDILFFIQASMEI